MSDWPGDSAPLPHQAPEDRLGARLAGMVGTKWRPLRHRLSDEAVSLMAEQVAAGHRQMPVHLMLVDDSGPTERGRTACAGGLGEWVTGDVEQVTCRPCLEQVHA